MIRKYTTVIIITSTEWWRICFILCWLVCWLSATSRKWKQHVIGFAWHLRICRILQKTECGRFGGCSISPLGYRNVFYIFRRNSCLLATWQKKYQRIFLIKFSGQPGYGRANDLKNVENVAGLHLDTCIPFFIMGQFVSTFVLTTLRRRVRTYLTLNVRGPSYLSLIRSMSWLLMHKELWYWQCRVCWSWSYVRKDFKYICHTNVE